MVEKKTKTKIPAVAAVRTHGVRQVQGFLDFVREQGIVGVAIGLVIGTAVATVAKSLIDNIVMPPVGALLGSAEGLKGLRVSLGEVAGKEAFLNYGLFLNDLVNFLILVLVIYIVVRIIRLDRLDKKKQ